MQIFGVDCRNNASNLTFEPVIDEINEISYLKDYYNLFDNRISDFVKSKILEKEIQKKFNEGIFKVKNDDPFKEACIKSLHNENAAILDALNALRKKRIHQEKKAY